LQRRHQWTEEEICGFDDARASWADRNNIGIAGDSDAGKFCRKIGVRKTAAHCAPVADLIMRDACDGSREQWMCFCNSRICGDVAPAHPRAEAHAFIRDCNRVEIRHVAQIDEQ